MKLAIATPSYKIAKVGKIVKIDVSFPDKLSAVYNYVIYEYNRKQKKDLHRRLYYHPEYTEIRLLERNEKRRT